MSQAAHGNTLADGSEQTLDERTTDGHYQLTISTTNLANGDTIELRVYTKPRDSAGAVQKCQYACYANAQDLPIKNSIPVSNSDVKFTLKQTTGTYRYFEWSVRRLDA